MKNMTTRDFCLRFSACEDGTAWALKYADMRTCYEALLAGKAGSKSAEWAIWVATREGVMSDRDLRLFCVRCARRVVHLAQDERSVAALEVAEMYAIGQATEAELASARAAARAAAWATAWATAFAKSDAAYGTYAARGAACAAADVAEMSADARADVAEMSADAAAAWAAAAWTARSAERMAQLKLLAEFGNPFEGEAEA